MINMDDEKDTFPINEKEVMDYYGYSGSFGRLKMKTRFLRSWILHSLAYSSPLSNFSVKMQRARGVKIGKNCHMNPYVLIDLIYPKMIEIGNNVTLGSHSMIFAHSNPPAAGIFFPKNFVTIMGNSMIFPSLEFPSKNLLEILYGFFSAFGIPYKLVFAGTTLLSYT